VDDAVSVESNLQNKYQQYAETGKEALVGRVGLAEMEGPIESWEKREREEVRTFCTNRDPHISSSVR